jgi:DNA repair exonuclease SbcCD ATPase subunit
VLQVVHSAGYSYLRAAPIEPNSAGAEEFNWYLRLDTDEPATAIRDALTQAWHTRFSQTRTEASASIPRLERENSAFRASVTGLQARTESLEELAESLREQLKALHTSHHDRAKTVKELQSNLRIEKERNATLMLELDTVSLSVRRLSTANKAVEKARRELAGLRRKLVEAKAGSDGTQQEPKQADSRAVELLAKLGEAEGEVERLVSEQKTIQSLLASAEDERNKFELAALTSRQDFELLKLEIEEALAGVRTRLEAAIAAEVSLDVLDSELTDLRTAVANARALQGALPDSDETSDDDEAADETHARMSRMNAALQLLRTLATHAFPRLALSEPSIEEIVVRRLHTPELWRELSELDRPGELSRSSNRIGESDWRELRQHINERTRIYWRPHEGKCLIHVWWKKNNLEQQRLHDALVRNPLYGF